MKNKNSTSQKLNPYRGTVLIETAIAITLLLMFLLGIIGFGYFFWRVQQVAIAARNGARIAIRDGAKTTDVEAYVADYLNSQNLTYNGPYITNGSELGDPVTVSVQGTGLDPMDLNSLSFFPGFPSTFTATVTMAKEGPTP